jgi:hypothetical protein
MTVNGVILEDQAMVVRRKTKLPVLCIVCIDLVVPTDIQNQVVVKVITDEMRFKK